MAFAMGLASRTLLGWLPRLADDLDAAGYNRSAIRLFVRPVGGRPRMTLFTDLAGEDRLWPGET